MSRNPYHITGNSPQLRLSVFALMDILGYQDLINRSEQDGTEQRLLNELHEALISSREWLEPRAPWVEKHDYALKAFTDNIVIGWPIGGDAEHEFGRAFFRLSGFQFEMARKGFFIRGALSVGSAYIDEIAVFGNALNESYIGESTFARDPRIIFTKSAVETTKKHLRYYADSDAAPHVQNILQDTDGQWFLNYLDCVLLAAQEQGPFYEEFLEHKKAVETKLERFKNEPTIWSKYAWVAGYHNFFCDLHDDYFDGGYKIDVDLFRTTPKLIVE